METASGFLFFKEEEYISLNSAILRNKFTFF